MEPVGVQEFSLRVAGIICHPVVYVYKVQVVTLSLDLFFDDLIGIADTVDDVPAGDAWLNGNKSQWNISKPLTGAADQLLEEDKDFFGMAAIAQVVISGIDDH